jgi:precorrin-6B methylase 2
MRSGQAESTRTPHLEVRHVPGGLELRVDGTLASFSRHGGNVTGPVWWALAAPVLLLPPARRRILLLGLGAGSVARAIRTLAPSARILGVERDDEVLGLARKHFGLDLLDLEVVSGCALEYLRCSRRSFDLIIDDVFVGTARSVRKPDWLLGEGYDLVRRRLRLGGLLVCNTIHETREVAGALKGFPGRILSLDVRDHWNRIVVCGRDLAPARDVRAALEASPALAAVIGELSVRSHRSGASVVSDVRSVPSPRASPTPSMRAARLKSR